MAKVCHVSSAHQSHDIRIFVKECRSLAAVGHEVYFVVHGKSEELDGVHIVGLGDAPASRRERMISSARTACKTAAELHADVYHLHDPELLPYANKLKRLGAKVVFDSHEDVAGQIMEKDWIPLFLRRLVSRAYHSYESYVVRSLDAVVTATPHIAEQFKNRAKLVVAVNNFPVLDDIVFQERSFTERPRTVCFTGRVSDIRGGLVMLKAMEGVDGTLAIAGPCETDLSLALEGSSIEYLGTLPHERVNGIYAGSRAGVILYQPAENHCESQPNKLFEYMAAGLPVIASNFPLWREVVEGSGCGICVPPYDAESAGEAIASLIGDPERAQRMGRRGRKAVEERYNWEREKEALIDLYGRLSA